MARQDADEALEEEGGSSRPGFPVDVFRLRRALLRGKWWLLAAGVIGALVGFLIGKFVVKRSYEAHASIQYSGLPGQPANQVQREQAGLVAAAHSEEVLSALRDRLGDMDGVPLAAMRAMVLVNSDPGSGLVTFSGFGEQPERAALMANSIVELFLAHHEERRRTTLQSEIEGLTQRMVAAQEELTSARQTYDTFRHANHITDLSAEQEAAIERAADIRSRADLGQAEVESLQARVEQLRGQLGRTSRTETTTSSGSESSTRLRQLRQALAEAQGQGLGDNHPRVQSLQRQVAALERSGTGGGTSRTSTNPVYAQLASNLQTAQTELEAARQRVATLEQLATNAQAATVRFSEFEGQAATLLAQVNVKQSLLNDLNESRSDLEDQLRDLDTGFRSVAEARPPDSALPSKKKYAVAAGIPAAFVVIMMLMLLFRELRGLTVHTAREVAFWGNGPVIGQTTWPRNPRALLDLIADLDDFAPDARGTMLVVGATDADRDLATEIASQLNHDWTASTQIDVPLMGSLPPNAGRNHMPPGDSYVDSDGFEVVDGEIHDGPTEVSIPLAEELALLDLPTEVERPLEAHDATDRLICTAWTQRTEGQALRRAARLADRVLVVVSAGGLAASELATIRTRLGISDSIGFVLTGVSDDVSKLPDRAGEVEVFWTVAAR